MKAILLTFALWAGLAVSGYSQNIPLKQKRTPEERARMMTEALDKKINLSAEQESKVYELYLQRAKDTQKMQRERLQAKQERLKKNKEQLAEQDKKLQNILNEEQYKVYLEQRKISNDKMKKSHPHKKKRKA